MKIVKRSLIIDMEISTEVEAKLKYNLAARVASVPRSQGRRSALKRKILQVCDIHRNTWDKWVEIEFESDRAISYENLKKLAVIFKCEVDDLYNKEEKETAAA